MSKEHKHVFPWTVKMWEAFWDEVLLHFKGCDQDLARTLVNLKIQANIDYDEAEFKALKEKKNETP